MTKKQVLEILLAPNSPWVLDRVKGDTVYLRMAGIR